MINRRKEPESYQNRSYRGAAEQSGLVSTYVTIRETDLHILAESDVREKARELATRFRLQIEGYIKKNPEFEKTLAPLSEDILAPPIIRDMIRAGLHASVGPMAAVAGAIAEYVGNGLLDKGLKEVIVENGGDLFLKRSRECTIAVFAGESPLSNRIGIKVAPADMPVGICTSSGTIGHSLSFGNADSVTVLADSAVLADAAATRIGNEVGEYKNARDGVDRALKEADSLTGIRGVLVVCGDVMGAAGKIEIVPIT